MTATRVLIVEDYALVRTGLRMTLRASGFDLVGEAADGIDGERLANELRPDVAVIDLGLPGQNGLDLTRALKSQVAPPRVVILTMREDEATVTQALSAGVDGYCVKASQPQVVVDAVRTVAAGGAYFDPRIATIVLRKLQGRAASNSASPLSPRETEVLKLIAGGVSNTAIAAQLNIGLGTVKTHVTEILRTLSAFDRAHASAIALRNGFIV